jgi:SOS-response transcriptional repressor LexA
MQLGVYYMITMNDVKNELARAGITQKEFSEMLGVSLTAIQKWFNGTSHPTMKRYTQILKVLGLDENNNINNQTANKGNINNNVGGSNNSFGNTISGGNNTFGNNSSVSINKSAIAKTNTSFLTIPVIKRDDVTNLNNSAEIDTISLKASDNIKDRCFAFKYNGTDMRRDSNSILPEDYSKYSIEDNSLIVFDSSDEALNNLNNGDLVVCIADNKVNVRVLYNDGYETTLMPLNSIAQIKDTNQELNKNRVIGKVFLIR